VAVDEKVIVIVAPNGARRTQKNHQHLPLTAREVAEDTLLNSQVGATMVHAHARKMDASHSLEIDDNHRLYAAIRETVGDKVVVQLTTEAVGIYPVEQQMAMIKAVQPEAASFGLRELIQPDSDLEQVRDFFHWVAQQGIIAQYILYSAEEVIRYHQLKEMAILPPDRHHLLFVLGRYTEGQYSAPRDLFPFIVEHKDDTPWAMCAFGRDEHRCVSAALSLGGDVRVGFENNLYNMRGHIAYNNAVLVKQVVDTASSMGREIMSAAEFRQLLT
jgi:uncharacterized protein (DUF849 family)